MNYSDQLSEKIGSDVSVPMICTTTRTHSSDGRNGYSEHSQPIPWNDISKEMAINMKGFFLDAWKKKLDWRIHIPESYPDPWRCELYRFWLSVCSYLDATNEKYLSIYELMDIFILGPEGIDYMKKLRSLATIYNNGGHLVETNPDDEPILKHALRLDTTDVGDIMNVRYWFFWDQPEDFDYKWALLDMPNIPESRYEKFKQVCRDVIPDILVEPIEEEEILLQQSGSGSLGPDDKSRPVYFMKQTENYFSKDRLRGKLNYIQKCPGDTRYCQTLAVPHSNAVKLIEKQISEIAAEVAWSCYVKDPLEYHTRYYNFHEKTKFYYCRDMRKDGLTKNRRLIQIVLAVIKEKYPDLPACKYFSIYDDWEFLLDGTAYHPPRGIGLGMSSAITTIIQAVFMHINMEKLAEVWVEGHVDALFYHDDSAFGADNEDILTEFMEIDYTTLENYGCIVNKGKGFMAPWFVLCENYSLDLIDEKLSYQYNMLKMVHACENVTHAKVQFQSVLRYCSPQNWDRYLLELVEHFGYEFYANEQYYPALFGGWVPASFKGLDLSFWTCSDTTKKQQAASMVGMPTVRCKHPRWMESGKTYKSVVEQIFPGVTEFNGFNKDYDTGVTLSDMINKYRPHKRYGETRGHWSKVMKIRKAEYAQFMAEHDYLPLPSWFEKVNLKYNRDFFPPRKLLAVSMEYDSFKHTKIDKLYVPANPYLSFLKFHNMDKISDKIVPWFFPPSHKPASRFSASADERRRIKDLTFLVPHVGEVREEYQHLVQNNYCIPSREWFDPNLVICFANTVGFGENLPQGTRRPALEPLDDRRNIQLFVKVNKHQNRIIFPFMVSRIGFSAMENVDLAVLTHELGTLVRNRRALQVQAEQAMKAAQKQVARSESVVFEGSDDNLTLSEDSQFVFTDASLHDEDFFTWQCGKKNYRNWRNYYFMNIETVIVNINSQYVFNKRIEADDEDLILPPVERHLWQRSGGRINAIGIPILEGYLYDDQSSTGTGDQELNNQSEGSDPLDGSDSDIGMGMFGD